MKSSKQSLSAVLVLLAVDVDADGRLDLILAGRESRNAVWYSNQGQK
jgi:hypothetical protein